jgi:putative ABC transport system substrate-binding protein
VLGLTTRVWLLLLILVSSVFASRVAPAQQSAKVPRIGVLRQGSPPDPHLEAFKDGLRALGYVEGRNVHLEYRWAEGKTERLPALAADLVRLKVDVIVGATTAAWAAKPATSVIPIVMPVSNDPVEAGLIASLARPGGNVTGLTSQNPELPGKWMQLMKEAYPTVSRVAVVSDPENDHGQLKASEVAARALGVDLQVLRIRRPTDFEGAFAEAQRNRAEALVVLGSGFLYAHRARIVEFATTHRLPTISNHSAFVTDAGGLMSYGADFADLFRRAAGYVDRILKGAKAAELPVEQPTKFQLVVNLRAAKALALPMSASLLQRADEVIR